MCPHIFDIILAIDGVRRIRLEVQVWHSHQNWTSLHKLISYKKCLIILFQSEIEAHSMAVIEKGHQKSDFCFFLAYERAKCIIFDRESSNDP